MTQPKNVADNGPLYDWLGLGGLAKWVHMGAVGLMFGLLCYFMQVAVVEDRKIFIHTLQTIAEESRANREEFRRATALYEAGLARMRKEELGKKD